MSGKKFYTARGDDGSAGLMGSKRYPKSDFRFEVLGTIDEASASIGFAKTCICDDEINKILTQIQRDLYLLMGEVSSDPGKEDQPVYLTEQKIVWLEDQIAKLNEGFVLPHGFIIPGDSKQDAVLDIARTVVRRAERRLVELMGNDEFHNSFSLQYINRLSSLLFCLELVVRHDAEPTPITYAKEK